MYNVYIHELHYDDDHMMCGDDVKGVGQKGKRWRRFLWAPTTSKQGHCFCVIIVKKLDPLESSPPHHQTVTIIHRVL